ncbi:hypothetical protein [Streptomyces aidingensis]|uniref:Uncharacterized protein n=1 Tax=Streptomyces aidingensis TaxID=910347 RepID=A0A1I1TSM5_9ACTN|nr:hypothetical protein [Streptomyces aidingensis]SFD61514.1 hypothetical protein SAMN05421773_1218 [Streptomyces aidingensis]
MNPGRETSLGHREHPLLGRVVVDAATGRRGVLRAVCPEPVRSGRGALLAWLAPVAGGTEWTTAPENVTEAKEAGR